MEHAVKISLIRRVCTLKIQLKMNKEKIIVKKPRDNLIDFLIRPSLTGEPVKLHLPHDSPGETSEVPTGHSVFPATAEPALCSGFP